MRGWEPKRFFYPIAARREECARIRRAHTRTERAVVMTRRDALAGGRVIRVYFVSIARRAVRG